MSAQETKTCLVCGTSFVKPAGSDFDMCPSCLKKGADRYAARSEVDGAPRASRSKTVLWALLAVSVAINVFEIPRLKKTLALIFPPAPLEQSKRGDLKEQCTANLWNISALIQKGRWPAEQEMTCPVTKAPYVTRKNEKGDLVVSCPNPAAHGLKILQVSRDLPTPDAEPQQAP